MSEQNDDVRDLTLVEREQLADWLRGFASARLGGQSGVIRDFLPPPEHPLYALALQELTRVALEVSWGQGACLPVEHFISEYPELLEHRDILQELAFTEYRLRQKAGQLPDHAEYRERLHISTKGWPSLELNHGDLEGTVVSQLQAVVEPAAVFSEALQQPTAPRRPVHPVLPEVGLSFLGFELLTELGRGSFGRVYLAQQGNLADRPVALKISLDSRSEAQSLAQLQHPNIVPIYSVHQAPPFQAVCMPYLGSTTLADLLQSLKQRPHLPRSGRDILSALKPVPTQCGTWPARQARALSADDAAGARKYLIGLPYVSAVLWLGAQLADGLAHAHDRGILHRDLKPANILLTEDGTPLLLDFNLSQDSKTSGQPAPVGGTLLYMAPEQLEGYRGEPVAIDDRCDVYSLGIILYELLTGVYPFSLPEDPARPDMSQLRLGRRQRLTPLRKWNRAVTPTVEAIVQRCLVADPKKRYASARELREDLLLHLQDQPLKYAREPIGTERLRKWSRRHPRLLSPSTIGFVLMSCIVFGTFALVQWGKSHQPDAKASIEQALQQASADRQSFVHRTQIETHKLEQHGQALTKRQRDLAVEHALAKLQRKDGVGALVDFHEAAQLGANLEVLREELAEAHLLRGQLRARDQQPELALQDYLLSLKHHPQNLPAYRARAELLTELGQADQALADWQFVLKHRPQDKDALLSRAQVALHLDQPEQAVRDSSAALAIDDKFAAGYWTRALARQKQKQFEPALDDFREAVRLDVSYTTAYADVVLQPVMLALVTQRSASFAQSHQLPQAHAEVDEALKLHPENVNLLTHRALIRWRLEQLPDALADCEKALSIAPTSAKAMFVRGRVYQSLGQPNKAIADFERAVELEPAWSLPSRELARTLIASKQVSVLRNDLVAQRWQGQFTAHYYREQARLALVEIASTKAKQACDRGLLYDPLDAELYLLRAQAKYHLANFTDALRDCESALRLDAENEHAHLLAGKIRWEQGAGAYPAVIANCTAALRLNPYLPEALELRSRAYRSDRRPALALADDKKIAERQPVAPVTKPTGLENVKPAVTPKPVLEPVRPTTGQLVHPTAQPNKPSKLENVKPSATPKSTLEVIRPSTGQIYEQPQIKTYKSLKLKNGVTEFVPTK